MGVEYKARELRDRESGKRKSNERKSTEQKPSEWKSSEQESTDQKPSDQGFCDRESREPECHEQEMIEEREQSEEQLLTDFCNAGIGQLVKKEREKKKISRNLLAYGVMNRQQLMKLEDETIGWQKAVGDLLLHRMGDSLDYFEVVISREELECWKRREEICLLLPENRAKAVEKLKEFRFFLQSRKSHSFAEKLHLQFAEKQELICALLDLEETAGDPASLLQQAERAAELTMGKDWKNQWRKLWLAPDELEVILLYGAVRCWMGEKNWFRCLLKELWEYPIQHSWEKRQRQLIWPQIVLMAFWEADHSLVGKTKRNEENGAEKDVLEELLLEDTEETVWQGQCVEMGILAVENLRDHFSQRYALPLLQYLCREPFREFLQVRYERFYQKFLDLFQELYQRMSLPEHRIWQNTGIENVYEAGDLLARLREAYGKTQCRVVGEEEEQFISKDSLSRLERSKQFPQTTHFRRLMQGYKRTEEMLMPLLETDSMEVLRLRQDITDCLGKRQFSKAKEMIEELKRMVDLEKPRIRQELLFWEAVQMTEKTEEVLVKRQKQLMEALKCTICTEEVCLDRFPFSREEAIIYRNIAKTNRQMKHMESAFIQYQIMKNYTEIRQDRYGEIRTEDVVILTEYPELLSENKKYQQAVAVDIQGVEALLRLGNLKGMEELLYDMAWNYYELTSFEKASKAFGEAFYLAYYIKHKEMLLFLQSRKKKYHLVSSLSRSDKGAFSGTDIGSVSVSSDGSTGTAGAGHAGGVINSEPA